MTYKLTYIPFSERSVLIQWPAIIDENILSDVVLFKEKIKNNNIKGIVELKSAYNSLLIVYDDFFVSFENTISELQKLYSEKKQNTKFTSKQWEIPVCYDDIFAIDLDEMALEKDLSKEFIIELHSKTIYTVYFIGFLPGFMYLGGLNKKLHTPRKSTPRLKMAKGAVAIGGEQTGIYPSDSPGGWNVIGNSPIELFNPKSNIPCFANAGDKIIFKRVSLKEYNDIKTLVDAGVYQLESEVIDD
ncbi:5-oxoprolinase subunit PxpB [Flavivirga spongiicola]|uniref:5-oxoprolinase subunit PxpB n=1 Tax=Flavivirga spongiicola TaxID=421621 RepID=A0ABU7XM29_9FLAO|nr:5-oxoprolinase subunit PxpB [Flavivirga sp. MEBiC05379]MDO5981488.1 5-oxoprolinase subunit PxpB [Flavivirga sp. MEBiC05379]